MKKYWFLSAIWVLLMFVGHTQNVGINTDASKPDANAILDIKSGSKGLLIPRMSTESRNRIPNTKGLLVYDNTTDNFWYNTGREWRCIPHDDGHGQSGDAWLIKGNNNTKDKVNFLGTTNNVPLNIRVNNQPSGRIDSVRGATFWGYKAGAADTGTSNTAMGAFAFKSNISGTDNAAHGFQALYSNSSGTSNTANGSQAMYATTNGSRNTANGAYALFNNTGSDNTANGYQALYSVTYQNSLTATGFQSMYSNTAGYWNTATGFQSMFSNISGPGNTANGYRSLFYSTNGFYNTANGAYSLYFNTIGNENVANGIDAMIANTTGSNNAANGASALGQNTSGDCNVGDGAVALASNTTGTYNTGVGFRADVLYGNLTNATAIGSYSIVDASNKVRIGNAAVTVIEGQVPFTTPSDGRFKFNVQEDVKGLDFILHLRPVTYQFDVKRFDRQAGYVIPAAYDEASRIRRSGFIAQEVEKAASVTGYDFSGIIRPKTEQDHYSLSYDAFVVPLVKAMQEQQQIIMMQERKLKEQDKRIERLEEVVGRIEKLAGAPR